MEVQKQYCTPQYIMTVYSNFIGGAALLQQMSFCYCVANVCNERKMIDEYHTKYKRNIIIKSPVYNFINGRLADKPIVLKPLSWHLILCVFRYLSRKWQKISGCEYPDLIQNETPVHF